MDRPGGLSAIGNTPVVRLARMALQARESQVFFLLASVKPLKTIARDLHLSPKTASTYKTRVMQKLKVGSDAELVRYAVTYQLVK